MRMRRRAARAARRRDASSASEEADDTPPTIRVGDKIQWIVNDADQFPDGAVVEAIHASGEWLWVSEGLCKSGIPTSQVELIERGAGDPATPPPRPKGA